MRALEADSASFALSGARRSSITGWGTLVYSTQEPANADSAAAGALQAASDAPATGSVRVQQEGRDDIERTLPYGCNLRDELIARKINPYQSVTRWTNCNGKQLCGTCIVDVTRGVEGCTRRSLDEASTLRENPETYKLACITNVYGDIAVRIHPEVGAAQWTR